jgi:hypothetical protein
MTTESSVVGCVNKRKSIHSSYRLLSETSLEEQQVFLDIVAPVGPGVGTWAFGVIVVDFM